jgi:hypothetical protein
LSVERYVDRFVGPDVRVTEKIARRDHDIAEDGVVIDGSESIFRPLGIVRRFVTVSMERAEGRRSEVY